MIFGPGDRMAWENGFCRPMSSSDGVTGKVNPAKLLCFVPVIPGLEKPLLGKKKNHLGGSVITHRMKR